MKRIHKIIIWVIAVIITVFIFLNLTIPFFAKKIIVDKIEESFKVKASLGGLSITPPLSINLTNLEIDGLFKADRISVSLNILGIFAGKIVLSGVTLINPVITLEQSSSGKLNIPQFEATGKQPPVYITGFSLRNGRIIFIDKKADIKGFKVILSRINADISKVALPLTSLKTNFRVSADFLRANESKIGDIIFTGWVDFAPKDMDAKLNLRDLDITYFSAYFGDFISEKELLSAKLNIQTAFKSRNNDLEALTNFKLSDLIYAEGREMLLEGHSLNLAKSALDFFTDTDGNLILEFKVKTKLDNPSISIDELKKIILQAAAKNLVRQRPEDLIKKVSDNIEQFKDFGKEMKKLFKEKK
ncbi:MAG: DUF748 domain-containing protein [Candidatus Omnitrophica bacterium]|nr:DUF748 domain-containing protein [Candidatus Omnitrophota bacterium]